MTDIPFHRTPMGQHYYARQLPALLTEIRRLNDNLERLADGLKPTASEASHAKDLGADAEESEGQ